MSDDISILRKILHESKTIAVVGLSQHWFRPSYFAAKYMQEHGYRIIPVNPNQTEILGEKCYASLLDIPEKVDIVDCFRHPKDIPILSDQAIQIGAKTLWLQIGVTHPIATAKAEAAGLQVVQDRCVKIEHARLFGQLNLFGVNTGIISSRRPQWIPK